ncbi:MAG: hypothetical protein QOE70_4499 [Chthoniobacter sp.]|nr:hypothetical protein [Chthoniobacter sp.]
MGATFKRFQKMRVHSWFLILTLAAGACLAGAADNDLPKRREGDAAEIDEKLFLNDLGDALPRAGRSEDLLAPEPALDVEAARSDFERAQRKELRWQKLAKAGVLAVVEVETCTLQTARARVKFEVAQAAQKQREFESLRTRASGGQIPADALAAAEAAWKTAQAAAAEANESLQRLQLVQAEANLDRQRRLLAAGAGSRNQLERAKSLLLQLQAAAH